MTTTCVPRNDGSDCVGASALTAGIFMKNWAIKTKTLRLKSDDHADDVSAAPRTRSNSAAQGFCGQRSGRSAHERPAYPSAERSL